jgi:hypothetical protein
MKIVWLASYPRSGNTFVRRLLFSYLLGDNPESVEIKNYIPDIHKITDEGRRLHTHLDRTVLVKSHYAFSPSHPYRADTAGFIYVIRDPRDVLFSTYRYLTSMNQTDCRTLESFAKSFIDDLGAPFYRSIGFGTWPEHVGSWLAATRFIRGTFVTYEELRTDAAKTLSGLVRFLGYDPDSDRIAAAAEACSFEKTLAHKHENRSLGLEPSEEQVWLQAMGNGAIHQSLSHIHPDFESRYTERFGTISRLFGYR